MTPVADLDDAWPRLTFELRHEGPLPLVEFAAAMQRLAMRYGREAREAGTEDEANLYIAEIRKGSTIVEFVTQHPYALPPAVGMTIGAGVKVLEGANQLFEFGRNLGKLFDHFTGKRLLPEVTKADCDDMRALAAPIINSFNTTLHLHINDGSGDRTTLTEAEAREADNRAAMQRQALAMREEHILPATLLVWDQVRNAPGVEQGERSPDRAIVAEVDNKPRQTTFASDEIKQAMTAVEPNPFLRAFVVDVKVLLGPKGPAGYRVTALHDSLDRDE